MNSILRFIFLFCFILLSVYSQTSIVNKKSSSIINSDYNTSNLGQVYNGSTIDLANQTIQKDVIILGPEIPVLSGFYDWQTNGACPHYISWINNTIVHACYMLSTDSMNLSGSRRTYYAFSSNGGSNWINLGAVPSIRSGFPTLTAGNSGSSNQCAVIGNHYQPASQLTSGIHVDIFPGVGVFISTPWNFNTTNIAWPFLATLTNGKILVSASSYQGSAATDTGIVTIFNPNTNNWEPPVVKFRSSATSHLNMRWTCAAGPNGKALYVMDAISDAGGNFGGNRIFYWTSTDNGFTWSNQNILFNSFVDLTGDTVTAWLGLDAVYDNAGNFYVVYNTIADSFQTAKIWLSKNGAQGILVASNLQIPGSLKSMTNVMGNVISMDWPSVCVSEDNSFVYVGYSVFKQNDVVNNFQSADVYISGAWTTSMFFWAPFQITSGTADERYICFNRKAVWGTLGYDIHTVYQKDPQPGSAAFNDNAPISRAALIYRKITDFPEKVKDPGAILPVQFSLYQNFPNPFNPETKIRFEIPYPSHVRISVFDITGREIETIVDKQHQAGIYEETWNAYKYSSGIYIIKMAAGEFTEFRKMILLK